MIWFLTGLEKMCDWNRSVFPTPFWKEA